MKNKRILFALDQELFDLIKGESQRTGVPMSEIIRRAVEEYIKGGD